MAEKFKPYGKSAEEVEYGTQTVADQVAGTTIPEGLGYVTSMNLNEASILRSMEVDPGTAGMDPNIKAQFHALSLIHI